MVGVCIVDSFARTLRWWWSYLICSFAHIMHTLQVVKMYIFSEKHPFFARAKPEKHSKIMISARKKKSFPREKS